MPDGAVRDVTMEIDGGRYSMGRHSANTYSYGWGLPTEVIPPSFDVSYEVTYRETTWLLFIPITREKTTALSDVRYDVSPEVLIRDGHFDYDIRLTGSQRDHRVGLANLSETPLRLESMQMSAALGVLECGGIEIKGMGIDGIGSRYTPVTTLPVTLDPGHTMLIDVGLADYVAGGRGFCKLTVLTDRDLSDQVNVRGSSTVPDYACLDPSNRRSNPREVCFFFQFWLSI